MSFFDTVGTSSSSPTASFAAAGRNSGNLTGPETSNTDVVATEFASLLETTSRGAESVFNQSDSQEPARAQILIEESPSRADIAMDADSSVLGVDPEAANRVRNAGSSFLNEAGNLIDQRGNSVLAYHYSQDGMPPIVEDPSKLQPVTIPYIGLAAEGSTTGTIVANLNASTAVIEPADLPSATSGADTKFSYKSCMKAFDQDGNSVLYDMFFSKTGDNTWELSMFNAAGRDQTTGSFPYATGALVTAPIKLEFDTNGRLSKPALAEAAMTIPGEENGGNVSGMKDVKVYFAALTQGQQDFSSSTMTNGNALSVLEHFNISSNGTIYVQYTGGTLMPQYQLPASSATKLHLTNVPNDPGAFPVRSNDANLIDGIKTDELSALSDATSNRLEAVNTNQPISSSAPSSRSPVSDLIDMLFA